MALDINGYNDTFKAFVNFAQSKNPASEMNAVARGRLGADGALAGHQITASNTDELHKLRRSADDKTANDRTRAIFKNAIIEMFGGEAKIPASVKKAMMLDDYGCGRPLTARRILCVKNAIDANGTMRRRAYDERVSQFTNPETRQAALDMGYREPELVRLARAVNFYAETMHCTEAEALAEVGEPGTKANRLLRYGGWFLVNAEKFADGLRLLDLFENWFTDLSNAVRTTNNDSRHRANRNYPADSTITAFNAEWGDVTPNCRLGLERFVFEALAHDRNANLKATNGEEIFGAANNPVTSLIVQGFGTASLNTLLQVPHDKRAVIYKALARLTTLATNPEEARTGQGVRHFGNLNAKTIITRMLKNIDRIVELEARGKLDAATIAKTCFPEMVLPKRYSFKAFYDAIESISNELADDLENSGALQLIMDASGCTLEEARAAHQNGVVLPNVPYFSETQVILEKVCTVEGVKNEMALDLSRPSNYKRLDNMDQDMLGDEAGGFGVTFTGGERFIANGTQEGRANIDRIAENIKTLCGRVHPRQTASVMMLLSQSGSSVLRGGLNPHGFFSNEHSAIDYTLTRNDATGDIHVRFSSKKELPFAFEWTATVKYDGTVATTPFQFIDEATVAAKTAAAAAAIKNKLVDNMLIGGRGVSEEDCAAAARKLVGLAKGDFALLRLLTENNCEAARYILKADNLAFRTDDEIASRLEALRDNVSELRMATNGDTRTFDAVLARLADYNGRSVGNGALAKMIAISRKIDLAPFKGLSAASSPARLTNAMGKLLLDVLDAVYGAGLVIPNEPKAGEEALRIYSLAIAAICARLDDDAVRGFRDALYSGNGGTMNAVLGLVGTGEVTAEGVDHDVQVKIKKTGAALYFSISPGLSHVLHGILGVKEYDGPPGEALHALTEADVRPVYDALRPVAIQINPAHLHF